MSESKGRRSRAGRGKGGRSASDTSTVEWVVAGASALLVLAAIGFLVYESLTRPDTPPDIRIEVVRVATQPQGYVVEFRARNHGGSTASSVPIRGELHGPAGVVESAHTTVDYVPAGGGRGGGLFFRADPRSYRIEVQATGYDNP